MAKFTQANRFMHVDTPLGPDVLLLEKLSGSEAISELYHFQLELLAEQPVAFQRLLGQPVTVILGLPGKPQRHVHGIVTELVQGEQVPAANGKDTFIRYRAQVAPRLWLLTRRVQSRFWQQLSIPDILKQLLHEEWKLDVRFQLSGVYHPRDHVVQYRESDFAFVSRLMEDEGMHYHFVHGKESHELIVTDHPTNAPELPEPSKLIYEKVEGGQRPEPRVTAWEKAQQIRSCHYTLWDHCFELPDQHLEATQQLAPDIAVGSVQHALQVADGAKLEIYDYPGGYAHRFDGIDEHGGSRAPNLQNIFEDSQRTAKIRMQEEEAGTVRIDAASNCWHLLPDHRFTLERHFDANGEYRLTRVEHTASLEGAYTGTGDKEFVYANRFQCVPAKLTYRPRRVTARPRIEGTQTATVVGPAGEKVFVDKYGRVKVQFHWDRMGKKDARSSCWIRVAQFWAGKSWGAFFWPRIGHEVVVAFEDGDPDRPLIIGSVYNAGNMPPFELPNEVLLSGVKSCSEGQGSEPASNFNGIIINDNLGQEHVQVHSERGAVDSTETGKFTRIGKNHFKLVGGFPVSFQNLASDSSGSGAGGGTEDVDTGESHVSMEITPGVDVGLTIGASIDCAVGLLGFFAVGTSLNVSFNPLGNYLAGTPSASKYAEAFRMMGGALMGESTVAIGAETSLAYGPAISIHRGRYVSIAPDETKPALTVKMAYTVEMLSLAQMLLSAFNPGGFEPAAMRVWTAETLSTVLLGLLVFLESLEAAAESSEGLGTELESLATHLATTHSTIRGAATDAVKAGAHGLADHLARILAPTEQVTGRPPSMSFSEKPEIFGAQAYTIIAQAEADYTGSTHIHINARGKGDGLGMDGSILMTATKAIDVLCAGLTPGVIKIDSGDLPTSSIILKQGPPDVTYIQMYEKGIKMHTGLPDVGPTFESEVDMIGFTVGPQVAACVLAMKANEFMIGFTAPPGTGITMTPTSIVLHVGPSKITLNAQGVLIQGLKVQIAPEIQANITGTVIGISANGQMTTSQPIAQI